jgi:hypothetical protein
MDSRFTFAFSTYDERDMLACGDRFVADLWAATRTFEDNRFDNGAGVWTDLVLNWFANAAPSERVQPLVTVDTAAQVPPRLERVVRSVPLQFTAPRDGHGKALRVDQTHWRWPASGGGGARYGTKAYWKGALAGEERLACLFGLACVWASGKSVDEHYS